MQAHCYILFSLALDRYYVGHTTEPVHERLRKHNSQHKGFTGRANDWEIVYAESFHTKQLAYYRERQIKGWKSRTKIEDLIASHA